MEHRATPDEIQAMSSIDFVVPLKQIGIITRSVLEAIHNFYRPRRIIVVTKRIEGDILNKLLPFWNVGHVQYVDEETFFIRNYGLTFESLIAEYDHNRPGSQLKFNTVRRNFICVIYCRAKYRAAQYLQSRISRHITL